MSNVFTNQIISDIEESSLESEIAVLESILISLENCDYITEHASDASITNDSFRLIMEGFVMESGDKKGDGEGNIIQRFFKKISQIIGGIFKKNPGKVELSDADKKKLKENVDKAKKNGGPITFIKKHKLLTGATIGATATGYRLIKNKIKQSKDSKEGGTKMRSLNDALNSIEIDGDNIKIGFNADLKGFVNRLSDASATFEQTVTQIVKLRSTWTSGTNGTSSLGIGGSNYGKEFIHEYFDKVERALKGIAAPFKLLYNEMDNDKDYVMSLDEWNAFTEDASAKCVKIAEQLNKLSDWMPSEKATDGDKEARIKEDLRKLNPTKTDNEINDLYNKTYGNSKIAPQYNLKAKEKAAFVKLRNDMSDIHNDYIGMNKFFKDVKAAIEDFCNKGSSTESTETELA